MSQIEMFRYLGNREKVVKLKQSVLDDYIECLSRQSNITYQEAFGIVMSVIVELYMFATPSFDARVSELVVVYKTVI